MDGTTKSVLLALSVALAAVANGTTATEAATTTTTKGGGKKGDKALTLEDMRVKLKPFIEKHGRETFTALLQRFGAAKLPEVKAEQYADMLALAEQGPEAIKGDAPDDLM